MVLVPAGVVTVMSTVLAPAGATAMMTEGEPTVNEVAGVAPNRTAEAFVKEDPLIVIDVPPEGTPAAGVTLEIAGPLVNVN